MGSILYDTLKKLNDGRRKCILEASKRGIPTTPDMSIDTIASLFSYVDPVTNFEIPSGVELNAPDKEWWLDSRNILLNAEERDGMKPRYIVVFDDESDTTVFYKKSTAMAKTNTYGVDYILTSDGAWLNVSTADVTHTWDKSQDIPTTHGGRRWAIGYNTDRTIYRLFSYYQSSAMPFKELILGDCDVTMFTINGNVERFETISGLTEPTLKIFGDFDCPRYKANFEGITKVVLDDHSTYFGSYSYFLNAMYYIDSLNLDDIEILDFTNTQYGTALSRSSSYGRPAIIRMPKLKKILIHSQSYSFDIGDSSGIMLYAPVLEYIGVNWDSHGGSTSATTPFKVFWIYAPLLKRIDVLATITLGAGIYTSNLDSLESIGIEGSTGGTLSITGSTQLGTMPVTFPKLKRIPTLSNLTTSTPTHLSFPVLEEAYKITYSDLATTSEPNKIFHQAQSTIDLPALRKCTYFCNAGGALAKMNIPVLEEVTTGFYGLSDYEVTIPNLIAMPTNFLKRCYGLRTIHLPDDFHLSGVDLTDSTRLFPETLRDIISKLADVTSDTINTYEITFGAANIAKLTTEEWQVAIDKGWVITDLVEEASE